MARPRATPEQRELQRERIRLAARSVAREHGVVGVTVRSVAERAGVSQGTLYSYFSGLPELMRSLWLEPVQRADDELESQVAGVDDPVERLRILLQAFVDFALANPEVHRGAMLFVRDAEASPAEPLDVDALAFHRLVVGALIDGQAAGTVRAGEPRVLAQTLWSGVHGALALPVNADAYEIEPASVLTSQMIDLLIDAVTSRRGGTDAPRSVR